MTIKDDIKKKLNKIKEQINRKDFSEKENKKYKESMISINKHYHKGEYDKVDKILDKLKNVFQTCGLFFSGYAEGSSNNKFLEIYNPTDADISLDGYAYPSVSNAPSIPGVYEYWNTFDEGAVIAAGDVYVIAHGSADPAILAEADEFHTYLSNGDDGYALVEGDESSYVIIDMIGTWDADPGSGWEVAGVANGTTNHSLIRKSDVTSGNGGDWAASAGTDADDSEWIVLDQNDWTGLGSHDFTGSCVSGCTDDQSCNYDPNANIDDDSCDYSCIGCKDKTATNYDPTASQEGFCIYCEPETYAFTVEIHNYNGNNDDKFYINSYDGEIQISKTIKNTDFEINGVGYHLYCLPLGCYRFISTTNEVSYIISDQFGTEYLDQTRSITNNFTYSNSIDIDFGLLINCGISGCTDPSYLNYNISATIDDNSCIYYVYVGCTNSAACNYDSNANLDDGSCEYNSCAGCTDSSAPNYNEAATIEDGECCYGNYITITSNGFDIEIMDLNNNEVLFRSQYLYENSYCLASGCYKLNPSINATNATINNNFWSIEGIFSGKITGGENDIEPIYISVGGNNCIYGCTIQCACNYNSEASIYDGTCEYGSCSGCTYQDATNYDESAGNDDGSCEFQLANPCPTDINGDGSVNVADLLQFLGAFGTICE